MEIGRLYRELGRFVVEFQGIESALEELIVVMGVADRDFRSLPSSRGSRANRGNVVVGSVSVRRQGCEPPFLPNVWHLPIHNCRGGSTDLWRDSQARFLPTKSGTCREPRRPRPGH